MQLEKGKARNVLLVEDDAAILETLTMFLRYEGFEVLRAQSVERALQLIEDSRPDVVLLDYMLQDDTAEPIVEFLHKKYGRRVPVLLLTAVDDPGEKAEMINADSVIAKPFDLDVLLQRMMALLSGEREEKVGVNPKARSASSDQGASLSGLQ